VSRDPGSRPRAKDNQQLANATACLQITKPAAASTAPPISIVRCWCAMKDQARAKVAFAKLAVSPARNTLRTYCTSQGIKLP
jgi:hypothetical protein